MFHELLLQQQREFTSILQSNKRKFLEMLSPSSCPDPKRRKETDTTQKDTTQYPSSVNHSLEEESILTSYFENVTTLISPTVTPMPLQHDTTPLENPLNYGENFDMDEFFLKYTENLK